MNEIDRYAAEVEEAWRAGFSALLACVRGNVPEGYEERVLWGMPTWAVPLSRYPAGYLGDPEIPLPYLSIAAQKRHLAFYHLGLYAREEAREAFVRDWAAKGFRRKPDLGKSCARFMNPDELPLDVVARSCALFSVDEWVAEYVRSRKGPAS